MLYCIFFILCYVKLSSTHSFILDEFLNNCNYSSSNAVKASFTSKLWSVEHTNFVIYYTLCGYIHQKTICNGNAAACIKIKQDKSSHILGEKFILGAAEELSLESVNGSTCKGDPTKQYKFKIKFYCSEEMKETRLEIKNNCEYVVYIMSPQCEPKCTTRINEQLIDLRPLRGNFVVQSKERNFSITLCGSNPICKKFENGISFCETTNDSIIPLSKFQNEIMVYNKDKNAVTIRGFYKGLKKQDKRKVELIIKCNWNIDSSEITDKILPQQTKHYKFEMESSYGCIKLPQNCVITNIFFIYNLTNLYNRSGYLQVSNVPNGNIYLNICGPLQLKLSNPKNNCSNSFSQVCEVNNGNYINKGSILSKFEVVDDFIKTTFISGANCKDSDNRSRQHNTHVELSCSKTEEGPKFVRSEICDTFINWNTPLACPSYDKSSCTYIHSEFHNCSLHLNGQHYDLKPLTLNNSNYEIKDVVNKSIIYLLNVCGPVTDSEAPCDKNSMIVMKDLDQNNVKYRIKSLGKMDTMTILNGDVIIKSFSGSYCDEEGYYSSVVRFICSVIEEKPQLLKKTGCTFHFQWKTPYACPKIDHSSEKKCIIQDVTNNISLDFTNMKNTFLKVNLNRTYVFDLCKENYTECLSEKNCSYFPVQKKLSRQNDRTCLEFNLPKKCESVTDINMVRFELICDIIINNGHFNLIGLDNCTLKLELHTNLICSKQDVAVDVYRKHENFKYDATNEQILKKEENCSITNNLTGYKFYISSLQLNIPSLHCPEVSFNNQNHSVLLTYSDNTICKLSDKKGKYDYRILLKCSKDEMEHQMHSECSQEYENPKFCKLFETSILDNLSAKESNTSATGITIGLFFGVLGLIVLCIIGLLLYRKRRRIHYGGIYEKDGDL